MFAWNVLKLNSDLFEDERVLLHCKMARWALMRRCSYLLPGASAGAPADTFKFARCTNRFAETSLGVRRLVRSSTQ